MTVSAYPLAWPDGWPRTAAEKRKNNGPFRTTMDRARRNLLDQLRILGARDVVLSSWLPLRNDGQPRSDVARYKIEDPGVAVYFTLRGRSTVMARDLYWSVYDNVHSIGHAIEHLRGLERHGGAHMMERAFTGFVALDSSPSWVRVLEMGERVDDAAASLRHAEHNYRALAKQHWRNHEKMVALNLAIEQARQELRDG